MTSWITWLSVGLIAAVLFYAILSVFLRKPLGLYISAAFHVILGILSLPSIGVYVLGLAILELLVGIILTDKGLVLNGAFKGLKSVERKTYLILGSVFVLSSGFIYTLERGFSMLSTGVVKSGFFSGNMSGAVPEIEANGFFDNAFAPLFLSIGILLFICGFLKKP